MGDLDFLVLLGPFVCFARLARAGWVGLVGFFCSLVHFGRFFIFFGLLGCFAHYARVGG